MQGVGSTAPKQNQPFVDRSIKSNIHQKFAARAQGEGSAIGLDIQQAFDQAKKLHDQDVN